MTAAEKVQALIDAANGTTGESDADLTAAVGTLIDGYGQGSGAATQEELDAIAEGIGVTTPSTPESIESAVEGLIEDANEATGESDADLTSAVGTLIDGYGQGGGAATQEELDAIAELVGGIETPSTPAAIQSQESNLIATANEATGETDETLTDAVGTLIDAMPSGSISITENGTVDVAQYESAVVNVSGGGGETFVAPNKVHHEIVTLETDYNGNIVELSNILLSLTSNPSDAFRAFATVAKANPVQYEWFLYNKLTGFLPGTTGSNAGWRFNGTNWAMAGSGTTYSAKAFAGDKYDVYSVATFVPPEEV